MDKKSIANELYQVAVISVLAVGYSMLGKKILKIAPPSTQHFHRLSKDSIDKERKRHNSVIEALQAAQIEWAHKRQQ